MKNVHRMIVTILSFVFANALVLLFMPPSTRAQEATPLEPGKPIEREITGGESHTYQLSMTAGQFIRFRLVQQEVNVALTLTAPDGKQLVEMNLTPAGEEESLSVEAATTGSYRLMVRGVGVKTSRGDYRLEVAVKALATAQDRQRITAEALLIEADLLRRQTSKTAEQVIEKLQKALPLWHELGEQFWAAWSLSTIGSAYLNLRQDEKAIEYYEQALAIYREVRNRSAEGDVIRLLGVTYLNLRQNEKAIEYGQQSLAIQRELKNSNGEEAAHQVLASAYFRLNRHEDSAAHFAQALAILRETNRRGKENTLMMLGDNYYRLGQNEKSIEFLNQALVVSREVNNRAIERTTLDLLGHNYLDLSQYEVATGYYEQALTISREIKSRVAESVALDSLGLLYISLAKYEKAIEYLEQALAISHEIKNRSLEANTLGNLGDVYYWLGQYERAIGYIEQELAFSRALKDRWLEAGALYQLGKTYSKLGQYKEAVEYLEQALTVARETKAGNYEQYALDRLGETYRSMNRYESAIEYHYQALFVTRKRKTKDDEGAVLGNLMLDWKARNQPYVAIFYGKQSINLYQEIRSRIRTLDRELQQSYLKAKEDIYRQLADLLIAQGRLPEAEQVIRMLKEEEYFEYVRRDETNSPKAEKAALTPEEAELEKRYREIADKLTELGTERGALRDKSSRTPEEEQRLAKLEADLTIAGQMFQKFLDGLANELGKNAEASARVFQLRESQGMMEALRDLGKGTVALYTLVGEDQYRVILTTADVQKGFAYPIKAADLNRKILAFRDVLQNPKLDPLPLAQELYKILIAPLAKDLKAAKAETLMWSLDGVLRYVPIAALHDGDKYLVERWRNVVFTPASQTRLKDDVSRNWKALGLGVTKAHGERIPALPGVAEEMRGIIKVEGATSGVLPGTIKLDEQFTQEAMLTGLRQRPPVVHVASHFQFKPGNETDSALLLGDGNFLSLAQIKALPNVFSGVELLTLSACNTATGGSGATGKEVEGFGVLAQRQGAKAVIASLWPVADRSTKNLMQEFYKLREAKANTTKAEAIRQAQVKLLRGALVVTGETLAAREITHTQDKTMNQPLFKIDPKAPYAHPYYWAPFILIGNWK